MPRRGHKTKGVGRIPICSSIAKTHSEVVFENSARDTRDSKSVAVFLNTGSVRKVFALLFRRFRAREFLEARIIPQRIEHWIEPKERRSEAHGCAKCAFVRHRQHFL